MTPTDTPDRYLDAARYRTRDDMLGGLRRQLRALPEYAASTGEVSLSDFQDLAQQVEAAQLDLVARLLADGWSWARVGAELGMTRTAAQRRWGSRVKSTRAFPGAQTLAARQAQN